MVTVKAKIIIPMIVIVVVLAVAIGVFGADEWFNAGSKVKDISQNKSSEAVAKVGDEEITKDDVDKMMALYEVQEAQYKTLSAEAEDNGLPVPPKKVWDYDNTLNKMIDDELMYQEAKNKGYEVSTEDAQKYARQTRETIQKVISGEIDTPNRDEEIKSYEDLKEFMKGLGVTEDEYWESLVPEYQRLLTIGKLRKEILTGIPAEKRNDMEYVDSYMKSYTDKLKDKYKVEIFD